MSTPASKISETPTLLLNEGQTRDLGIAISGFSKEQLIWSSGYLAGLASVNQTGQTIGAMPPASAPAPSEQLTILYGSQTGNGLALATALHDNLRKESVQSRLVNMADYRAKDIGRESWIALVVSTHGEGEAPDDAELLLEYLQSKRAPKLDGVNYFILALGDSSYEHFCKTGRDFDLQLSKLGATRLTERIECDVDYAADAAKWHSSTVSHIKEKIPQATTSRGAPITLQVVDNGTQYTKAEPFHAEILVNQRITGSASSKTVHHLELDLESSGLSYEPGDALGVITPNPPELVEEVLTLISADANQPVTLDEQTLSLRDAFTNRLELTLNSGAFLQRYAELIGDADLAEKLASPDTRRALLNDYQVVDVLHEWPITLDSASELNTQSFVDTLRTLEPRVYSISSSPVATPDEVHITVAEVSYEAFGRLHAGSASTSLIHASEAGQTLPVFVERNTRFRLPTSPSTDIIMIGPGTGVAPFRAFVEQRAEEGATGRNWLFFGDRNFDEDFLYQLEWQRRLKQGHLHRLELAFSRDQKEKIYVQDRLIEHGKQVYAWLLAGASIYVCGDASKMASDVHAALQAIVVEHGAESPEAAEQYLKTLKREKRYMRDVY